MAKNIIKQVICIFILTFLFSMVNITTVNADEIETMHDMIMAGQDFLDVGDNPRDVIDTSNLKETSNFIYNMALAIAIVVAVGVGMVLGIKFITSSVEEQAKIKEALVPYVVGCIVVFAAFPIWSFIVNAGQDSGGIKATYKCPYCKQERKINAYTASLAEKYSEPEKCYYSDEYGDAYYVIENATLNTIKLSYECPNKNCEIVYEYGDGYMIKPYMITFTISDRNMALANNGGILPLYCEKCENTWNVDVINDV